MRARLPLLLAMAAMLVVAVVASRGDSAVHPGPRTILPVDNNPPPTTPPPADDRPNAVVSTLAAIGFTGVLLLFGALFLIGVVVIVMGVSFSRTRRARLSSPITSETPEDTSGIPVAGGALLRSAIAAAQRDLAARQSGPPSDAVVAAWLRLEQAAADSGAPRAAHQTPTEFTSALLAQHVRDHGAVEDLRGLYQRARFGRSGSTTAADAEQAQTALGAILEGWQVPA